MRRRRKASEQTRKPKNLLGQDLRRSNVVPWSDESVSDCVLCRGLDVGQRAAMRADPKSPVAKRSAINVWTRSPPIFLRTLEEGGGVVTARGANSRQ